MNEPEIFKTTHWSAREVRLLFEMNTPKGIIVHHTAGTNRKPTTGDKEKQTAFALARSIQKFHMGPKPRGRGWADSGQNFLISRGGLILEGRTGSLSAARKGKVPRGAHAGTDEGNRFFFGIEVEGNNEFEFLVTEPQWESLVTLCGWLSFWGQFQSSNILPHKNFRSTVCPGHLAEHLPKLALEAREIKLQLMEENG